MKINKHIKIATAIIIFLSIILFSKVYGAQFNVQNEDNYTEQYLRWLQLSEEEKNNAIKPLPFSININQNNYTIQNRLSSINNIRNKLKVQNQATYNLKDVIEIPIKNQMQTNSCWVFSANSSLETLIALKEEENLNFSERHIEYATSRTFLNNEINSNCYNREVGDGGNAFISMGYYTSGQGPILETEMPFENNENKINLTDIQNKEIQRKIDSYVFFPTVSKKINGANIIYTNGLSEGVTGYLTYSTQEIASFRQLIKEHIVNSGGIMAVTYTGGWTVNRDINKILGYCADNSVVPDHAITIIGWDDNFSKTNFPESNRPNNDGAYIALNSFGTNVVGEGYVYISYDDVIIESSLCGLTEVSSIEYDNIYQHDLLGLSNYVTLSNNNQQTFTTLYGANVFSRENDNDNEKKELLTEISFNLPAQTEAEIYVNPNNKLLSSQYFEKVQDIASKDIDGYYTTKLDTPILLTGEEFAILIKYKNSNGIVLPVECNYLANGASSNYWDTAASNEGESYISSNFINWTDLVEVLNESNICIKAFTTEEEINIEIESEVYTIEEQYIKNITLDTTLAQLKSNLITSNTIKVLDGTREVEDNEKIKTNMSLMLENQILYLLSVTADVNGDGELTLVDLSKMKLNSVGINSLQGAFLKAADLNKDGEINLVDLSKMKRKIVGLD